MTVRAFLQIICLFRVFHEGLTSPIQTHPTVTAVAGDQARLDCQLMETKDIHQVTWQKILPGGERNVATYNKHFGQRVDPYFEGRVELKGGGLENSSIVIREVTEQDEGCYHCLFNTYPDGALTGKTCLYVHELHGPFLNIIGSNSTEEVVSCSATSGPAPTVTITSPQRDFVLYNSSISVTNNNNSTVTVTETAVLSRVHYNSTQVGCAVQVLSAPQKQVFMMIPEVRHTPTGDGFEEESESGRTLIIALTVFLISGCVPLLVFLLLNRNKQSSLPHSVHEMNEIPPASDGDLHED